MENGMLARLQRICSVIDHLDQHGIVGTPAQVQLIRMRDDILAHCVLPNNDPPPPPKPAQQAQAKKR